MEAYSVSYALLNSKGVVVMFDISKELLLKQFENRGKTLDTGIYCINKCLQYKHSNKFVNTNKFVVVL